jgi:Uma2 family endonuclease
LLPDLPEDKVTSSCSFLLHFLGIIAQRESSSKQGKEATMLTRTALATRGLLLDGVDWKTYTRLLRALDGRPGLRLTYDRGSLEIMTLTHEHENYSYILGRLVDALTEELNWPVKGGRSTTFRQRRKQRGLEPDNCWWIASESAVRGKDRIDLRIDPPPDLAIEVDITHSSLDRLAIYAALRVPEVWQHQGKTLVFYLLGQDYNYAASPTSRAFPGLAAADVMRFLALRGQMDDNALVRQFRVWARQQFARQGP